MRYVLLGLTGGGDMHRHLTIQIDYWPPGKELEHKYPVAFLYPLLPSSAMADRQITQSGKNHTGDITSLCNRREDWSPRLKSSAINDIESEKHQYYILLNGERVDIHVIDHPRGKYLHRGSSGRRCSPGADRQLEPAPLDRRRRDRALCRQGAHGIRP